MSIEIITEMQIKQLIRKYIKQFGNQKSLAEFIGVSGAYISAVMRGDKEPRGKLLKFLNIESHNRTVTFYILKRSKHD